MRVTLWTRKWQMLIIVVAVAVAGMSIAVYAARQHKAHHGKKGAGGAGVTAVQVATAGDATVLSELSLSALVSPDHSAQITAPVTGVVNSLNVTIGQTVTAGEVLASISSPLLTAQRASAQATLAAAQAKLALATAPPSPASVQLDNLAVQKAQATLTAAQQQVQQVQTSYNSGSATKAQLDTAQSQETLAQLGLSQAQVQLQALNTPPTASSLASLNASVTAAQDNLQVVQTEINQLGLTSPYSGVVAAVTTAVGQRVTAGSPILTVDSSQLSIEAPLMQNEATLVHPGQSATISIPGGGTVNGAVSQISPATIAQSLAFQLTVSLNSTPAWIKPGELAAVQIVTQSSTGVVIPADAIVNVSGSDQVFIIKGKVAALEDVTPGITDGTYTEVTGVTPGQEVVTLGQAYLAPGDKIRVTERATMPTQLIGSSVGGLVSTYTPPLTTTKSGAKGKAGKGGRP